ncbi:MAG: hypothetical protein HOQ07_01435 [Sinomonas sp.]|nr:hypothetical protein [Sinomonas sp.]
MAPSRFLPLRRSARAALLCSVAAAVFLGLTAWTLEEWLGALALVALAGFILCALYAVLGMNRYWVAAGAMIGAALTVGCSLAFLRVLGLAWDDAPDKVTSVSSRDADPYFAGAVIAAFVTLTVLFAGAAWPRRRMVRRPAPAAVRRKSGPKAGSSVTRGPRPSPTRSAAASDRARASSGPRPAARRNG